jgi:hypothetical protein
MKRDGILAARIHLLVSPCQSIAVDFISPRTSDMHPTAPHPLCE